MPNSHNPLCLESQLLVSTYSTPRFPCDWLAWCTRPGGWMTYSGVHTTSSSFKGGHCPFYPSLKPLA